MAVRPKSICRHAACGALIESPGYCDKHVKESTGWNRSNKGSSADRGYGAEWRKKRERVLRRDCGVCQPCLKRGRIHEATEVDHIVSKAKAKRLGWTQAQMDDESNLQAINADCHTTKTIEERNA